MVFPLGLGAILIAVASTIALRDFFDASLVIFLFGGTPLLTCLPPRSDAPQASVGLRWPNSHLRF